MVIDQLLSFVMLLFTRYIAYTHPLVLLLAGSSPEQARLTRTASK